MQQTFPMEQEPRVILTQVGGDLEVRGWDKQEISVDWDDDQGGPRQEGNVLTLVNCSGDVTLWTPRDTEVRAESLKGDVVAHDLRRIELKGVAGNVELSNIGIDANLENIGEAILLERVNGDLDIQKASSLRTRHRIDGDVSLREVPLVEMETVGGDLEMSQVEMVSIGNVGGELEIDGVSEMLRCGNVGGDSEIGGSTHAEINLGNLGGDLEIAGALRVHLGNTGGDVEIRDVQDEVHIGNIAGEASIVGVGGDVRVGRVGSDAELRGLVKSMYIGAVAGDLKLQSDFPPESRGQLHVGGDAAITLPMNANVAVQATVGGEISGPSLSFSQNGNIVRLIYGEGAARLNLSVGGDLELQGGSNPQVNSAGMPWWEFGQEMSELGQAMAEMGQELEQEFREIFSNLGWTGAAWTSEMSRKVEEQVRRAREKAEQNARKAEERARQAQNRARGHADRVRVHINEREWAMNPDRLNDLVSRAQRAAMEGVAGALEAVERSVGNLNVKRPPRPPQPGWSPVPPKPPVPPVPPVPPESVPGSSFTRPAPGHVPGEERPPNLEQEREAILRMIAEGRITPEEGDMLLEGLGS